MTTLTRIRLELGRSKEFPVGSANCGYEFIAPLDAKGHIDATAWRINKSRCGVRRFWTDHADEHGMLRHVGSGSCFDYDGKTSDDGNEPFFKLDQHAPAVGAYVTIKEHDGVARPFKVVDCVPLTPAA